MDCQSKENDKAKKGAAKTKKEVPIVNVMSTVEAAGRNRGMPLAYYIAPGNRPDVIKWPPCQGHFEINFGGRRGA